MSCYVARYKLPFGDLNYSQAHKGGRVEPSCRLRSDCEVFDVHDYEYITHVGFPPLPGQLFAV